MPYNTNKFCGASIRNFQTSIGWGTQKSSCKIELVEDPVDGDVFVPPTLGTPALFYFEGFRFLGIMQKWEKSNSFQGVPLYSVTLEDPRDILDGCELIVGSYTGAVTGIPNLINVFGYYENAVFGSSGNNGGGMPWYKIKNAVEAITASSTSYGGPLVFRGYSYAIDLSELPVPPSYYRIGGTTNIGLLTAISTLCQDGGYDFYVELSSANVIKVRTVNRLNQPSLGTISAYVADTTNSGVVSDNANGLELRNEITSAFVVGGPVHEMYEASSMKMFWGFDQSGNVLASNGTGGYSETFNVNAKDVEDVIGGSLYNCSIGELCCALKGVKDWIAYISANKPVLALTLGIDLYGWMTNPNNALLGGREPQTPADKMALMYQALQARNYAIFSDETSVGYPARMFNFVRGIADDYYGKKFLVEIPFTLFKVDEETFELKASQEAVDAAYFSSSSSGPLGLDAILQERFKVDDGRFQCFVLYQNASNLSLDKIQPGMAVFGTNGVYVKSQVSKDISSPTQILSGGSGIVMYNGTPHVVVEVSNPVFEAPVDTTGGGIAASALLFAGEDPAKFEIQYRQGAGGIFNFKVHQLAKMPQWAAIPLKSNILTYGPWYEIGATGKTRFEVDSSLSPWMYGGYTLMNLAGEAKVSAGVTFMQLCETGTVKRAGAPEKNLGDVLASGGPNITSINVSWSESGITTTYSFSTFTPRLGVFEKGNIERFQRIGNTMQKMQRNINLTTSRLLSPSDKAVGANLKLLYNLLTPDDLKRESPHPVFLAQSFKDAADTNKRRVNVSTQSIDEATRHLMIHSDDSKDLSNTIVLSSLDAVFRPFSSKPLPTGTNLSNNYFPTFTEPVVTGYGITSTSYNPFATGNDIEIYVTGTGKLASGMDARAYLQNGPAYARSICLRGPLVISGWGYDIDGKPVPGDGSGGFESGYLRKFNKWPTGPIDLRWDYNRGVWTAGGVCIGVTQGTIPATGTGLVQVWAGTSDVIAVPDRPVKNFFSSSIADNTRVMAAWVAEANAWYVVAADC